MSAKHLAALREKERRRNEQPAIKRLKMTETGIQSAIESESEDYREELPTRKKKRKKRIITPSEVEDSESEEPERDELPIRKKK